MATKSIKKTTKKLSKGATVYVKNLKKNGLYGFSNESGFYIKFKDGSDGFFKRKDFTVI